jgi:hypothetical protein
VQVPSHRPEEHDNELENIGTFFTAVQTMAEDLMVTDNRACKVVSNTRFKFN